MQVNLVNYYNYYLSFARATHDHDPGPNTQIKISDLIVTSRAWWADARAQMKQMKSCKLLYHVIISAVCHVIHLQVLHLTIYARLTCLTINTEYMCN